AEQRAQLPALLAKGAEAFGFRGDLWTTPRIADLIHRQFAVHYHPAHVSRILRDLGWSPQQPEERATQRDEEAIATWLTDRWADLKKTVAAEAASGRLAELGPASFQIGEIGRAMEMETPHLGLPVSDGA